MVCTGQQLYDCHILWVGVQSWQNKNEWPTSRTLLEKKNWVITRRDDPLLRKVPSCVQIITKDTFIINNERNKNEESLPVIIIWTLRVWQKPAKSLIQIGVMTKRT